MSEEKSTVEIINDVLKNEVIKENCLINAKEIEEKMKGNWFTIDQLIKKTSFVNPDVAKDILDLLCLFGMCYRKRIKEDYIKYKITISSEYRKRLLEEELMEAKGRVLLLESEIEKIINKN
jgi:uncharacterized protein YajQ (UPF0234 family)